MSADVADDSIALMDEATRWRARNVSYYSGRWDQLQRLVPTFALEDFRATPDAPANLHMRAVVRQPRTQFEQAIPVGVVSNTYSLVQHADVAARCLEGIEAAGVPAGPLRCELGLTELGERMNLRIYFPEAQRHRLKRAVNDVLDLRLECFNSVDGTSRLVVLFGWRRLVCTNGLVIGETVVELQDVHNQNLTLDPIPELVQDGLLRAQGDRKRLEEWEGTDVPAGHLVPWIDEDVTTAWGPHAACRVLHICTTGHDVEVTPPFARGKPSEKTVTQILTVPGSQIPAKTLFDLSQALSWVATRRSSPEERVEWQRQIPSLVARLGAAASSGTPGTAQ